MHLSKVWINWYWAKDPYQLHRAIWQLFPGRSDDQRDFLFRVEDLQPGRGAAVLLQSRQAPESAEVANVLASKDYSLSLVQGCRLRFRLRANPVKSVADDSKGTKIGKNGKEYAKRVRVPLIHEEEQQAWLERKLESVALLDQLIIQREMPLRFSKPDGKQRMAGKVQPVLFDGVLVVQDPQALLECLQQGIGPAKSFGCGLLSLAMA